MNCTQQEKIIKSKIGLLQLAEELGNVSRACKTLGYSRDTFYRYKELYQQGGVTALIEKSKRNPCVANRIAEEIENRVIQFAINKPYCGQHRVSHQLKLEGISVSPGGVRSIWLRNNLETFQKRLKALEAHSAKEGVVLTEEQLILLEKSREEKIAYGEIETNHPGYLLSQDTYYVGIIKGVGRIYQQTVIDTYSRVGFAKLYINKTAITAADILNDKVIPWFEEKDTPILRMLTDRGTEFNGDQYNHPYEIYLKLLEIEHSRTKAYSPQTNGICERFHQTIQNEFYAIAFRKKIYGSIDDLQLDLDIWLKEYNENRAHSGKYCFGRTPEQTFNESKHLVESKCLDKLHQKEIAV
jgi:transposase InsO family protein